VAEAFGRTERAKITKEKVVVVAKTLAITEGAKAKGEQGVLVYLFYVLFLAFFAVMRGKIMPRITFVP
jgi:hypothetical protein